MEKCISTLDQEQREKLKYEEDEILDFLRQFINGYKVLYDLNIIHRDIKPANILIQYYGNKKLYKLADFGIAQFCEQNNLWLTKLGSPMLASPELNVLNKDNNLRQNLVGMKKQHQRSVVDMYSLGIILNLMITGEYPYKDEHNSIIDFIRTLENQPFKVNQFDSEIIQLLVEGMIEYYPEKRMTFQQLCEIFNRLCIVPEYKLRDAFSSQSNSIKQNQLNYAQLDIPIKQVSFDHYIIQNHFSISKILIKNKTQVFHLIKNIWLNKITQVFDQNYKIWLFNKSQDFQ
ncbi:unnamed protein product (macronuclear) [Paramecium tetraurelia]|uniref:Protein kinase domain-containing protein n=1 Tax=Paramecium tetraurelia TaxID=5888 RepID=A0CKV2_PARTE|nr:uncharacterized protein GSPATT00007966001 [Paramecium tetraurelia]CAK71419.1 unnamed protein product [Paramecium tetraurelia]|eukprot:XP_001438816.1 hypothetical protein (macronuclear) [Paramecium tetraurelia strain d4-2]